MKYQVVESFDRVNSSAEGPQKNNKLVHDLGECKSLEHARKLAHIWYHLMEQSGDLGGLIRETRFGTHVRLSIQDEKGNRHRWEETKPLRSYEYEDVWVDEYC